MEEYRYLIDSAQASASRTRSIIFLMLLTCFLSLIALWNELDTSWLRHRQIATKRCIEWFEFQPNKKLRGNDKDSLYFSGEEEKFRTWLQSIKIGNANILNEGFAIPPWAALRVPEYHIDPITDKTLKGIKASASLIQNRQFYTEGQAVVFLNALIETEVAHRLSVRIPILGVVFDINDLAVICGAAFNVLLFVFWFSLAREKKNIKFIFHTLREDGAEFKIQKKVYRLASMKQVFHIPLDLPHRYSSRYDLVKNRRINNLTYPIVLLPFLVNLSIFIYDRFSQRYSDSIDPDLSNLLLYTSSVLLLVNGWLTVMCAEQWREINKAWSHQHTHIREQMEAETRGDQT